MRNFIHWNALVWLAAYSAAVMASACGSAMERDAVGSDRTPTPPFKAVASVHELMHDIVYPNAEVVWESVGTIISYAGTEEIRPESEEEWEMVERSALTLAEVGNLLMLAGRAKDSGIWMEKARTLIDSATVAVEAARNRDAQAVFDSGEDVYFACDGCHEEYWEVPPSSMRP